MSVKWDKFIECHVGSNADASFTDVELATLAGDYHWVKINRAHGRLTQPVRYDRVIPHLDCAKLKALNPDLIITTYFPMSYRFDAAIYNASTFLDSFHLTDTEGADVRKIIGASNGVYVDLGNDAYRTWAIDVLTEFMQSAPWDGVHFDNSNHIAVAPDPDDWVDPTWVERLGQPKIDAWNAGLTDLLDRTRRIPGVKFVTWNGIARGDRKINRSLGNMDVSHGALNERFLYQGGSILTDAELIEDVDLMQDQSDKILNQYANVDLTNYPVGATRVALARFAAGLFALGWEPGKHYFKFGSGFVASANDGLLLTENAVDLDHSFGAPAGAYDTDGLVYRREFNRGVVYVNLESTAQTVTAPFTMGLSTAGVLTKHYRRGASVEIGAESAEFFQKLRSRFNQRTFGPVGLRRKRM